jgi:two-component system, NarL family, sensor kinase
MSAMRTRWLAGVVGLVTVLAAVGAVGSTLAAAWTFEDALQAFVVSNIVIGVSFGLCGVLIAWHRPALPLGWMYAAGGLCQTLSALAAPLTEVLDDRGAPLGAVRLAATVYQWAWPVNIALIPLSLLLLPDGRLASRRWRPVAIVVAATAPLFVLEVGLTPESLPGLPGAYGTLGQSTYDSLGWLWKVTDAWWALAVLVGVICLVVRYRAGSETVRRQLLWLVAAATVIVVAVTPWALLAGTPLAVLFTIPLLPAAVTAAVLRYQLLDIRLVVARAITYALLSALVLGTYAGLVLVLQEVLNPVTGHSELAVVVSTLAAAALFRPARKRIQSGVDRRFYRSRYDAERTVDAFASRLRKEWDLETVGDDLRATVDRTIQPASVSLWIRP